MRRSRLTLVGAMLAVACLAYLWSRTAIAQSPDFVASDHIFRITAHGCTFEPKSRVQTGFKVKGTPGIVTALHGIADCSSIQAADATENSFLDLTLASVDIARDTAVLTSAEGPSLSTEAGLEVARNVTEDYESLLVIGYPNGRYFQEPASRIAYQQKEFLSRFLSSRPPPTEFYLRNSPNKDIEVLTLEADMQPGHSGAPLMTSDRKLLGIIDGGLNLSGNPRAWAIPWHDLELRPAAERAGELARLGEQDPQLALLFSTTLLPPETYGSVEANPINDNTFSAYQYFFNINVTKQVDGQNRSFGGVFEGVNNEPRGQRSLILSGNLAQAMAMENAAAFPAINRMGYIVIEDSYYVLFNDACFQTDLSPELIGMDDLYTLMRNFIASTTQADLQGTAYGEEMVDTVRTQHYIMNPTDTQTTAFGSTSPHRLEYWVTVEGHYLVQVDFDLSFENHPALGAGRMSGSLMFHGLNSDPQVELPAVCQNAIFLPDNAFPVEQVSPTPTATRTPAAGIFDPRSSRRVTSTPTPTPMSGPTAARATLAQVWLEHNQVEDGENGMLIHADLDVEGMRGKRLGVTARFYQGEDLLRDANGDYVGAGGEVLVEDTLLPRRDRSTYPDFTLFMPYRELDLPPGVHELTTVFQLWNLSDNTLLAESTPLPFTYTLPESPLVDTGEPAALIENVWIDHNLTQDGELGMVVHTRFSIINLNGVECQAAAYIEYAAGGSLRDFDGSYADSGGNVAAATLFTPAFDDAYYADLTIFVPYAQLHMLPGTHDLRLIVVLYAGEEFISLTRSNYIPFTYTQPE